MSGDIDTVKLNDDIYLSFLIPLGRYINEYNWSDHHKAMTSLVLIKGAEILINDNESINIYCALITETLINIFASVTITLGHHKPGTPEGFVSSTTKYTIRDQLPLKDCYKFINLLMKIYDSYHVVHQDHNEYYDHSAKLPTNIFQIIDRWLIDNTSIIKAVENR